MLEAVTIATGAVGIDGNVEVIAGCYRHRDKPRQGVMANTLDAFRNGAVGFIDRLGGIAQSKTAVASISMRNSGTARVDTPIQVLVGGVSGEKNSLRALPTAVALSD